VAQSGQQHQSEIRPRPTAKPIAPIGGPESEPPTQANPRLREGAIPGLEEADAKIPAYPMRSEGTVLAEQRGSMLRLPTGEWAMVFHRDAKGRRERPMVLAPCQNTQRMEQLVAERGPETVFTVSGQVLAYLRVNYLLPTRYSIVPASEAARERETPRKDAAKSGKQAPGEEPSVESLIRDLESQRDPARVRDGPEAESRPQVQAAPAPAAAPGLLPEDTMVSRRRGRLTRTGEGLWAFTFDNGLSGESATDRPLVVVPCMNLALMERWAAQRGEGVSFEMSGRILTCDGRNYLLPSMFQVYPPNDLEPRQ
jgi:hypothetical protein